MAKAKAKSAIEKIKTITTKKTAPKLFAIISGKEFPLTIISTNANGSIEGFATVQNNLQKKLTQFPKEFIISK